MSVLGLIVHTDWNTVHVTREIDISSIHLQCVMGNDQQCCTARPIVDILSETPLIGEAPISTILCFQTLCLC
jgi:hypothetical protein